MSVAEDITQTITNVGDEMARQSNLSTQYPLWVVMESYKEYVGHEMSWEKRERNIWDGMDDDEFMKSLCQACRSRCEDGYEALPDECPTDDCDYDCYGYFNVTERPNLTSGMYLTQKACQEHIDENHYHYTDAHPYAYSAWRNPEMIAIMQFILKTANQEVPSYYQ